jgi:hypothetical protein
MRNADISFDAHGCPLKPTKMSCGVCHAAFLAAAAALRAAAAIFSDGAI